MREVDKNNHRAKKIYLTSLGQELLEKPAPVIDIMSQALFEGISDQDIETTQHHEAAVSEGGGTD